MFFFKSGNSQHSFSSLLLSFPFFYYLPLEFLLDPYCTSSIHAILLISNTAFLCPRFVISLISIFQFTNSFSLSSSLFFQLIGLPELQSLSRCPTLIFPGAHLFMFVTCCSSFKDVIPSFHLFENCRQTC